MSVGQHVLVVTADNKTFSGVLDAVDDQTGKIILKNVLTDGCRLPDLQTFYASQIKDLTFQDGFGKRDDGSDSLMNHVKRAHGNFLSKKNIPRHLAHCLTFSGDKLLLSHIAKEDEGDDQGIGSSEDGDNFEDFYETDDYLMLCRPCDRFREAIVYLMKQEYVAVIFYGVEIGREGNLSLLQIATDEYNFLFDICRLGNEGFIDGLQELLESHQVLKIIHDCRMVSDMLFHQYNIDLSNVFDTQVAGAFAYRNSNDGDWPRSVESLPTALMNHLNLSESDIHFAMVRERSRKSDEEVWLQRPLSKQLLMSTLKNLWRLIPLYKHMWRKIMLPFKMGVEIYLDNVRDAPAGTAAKQRVSSHLLPFAFQDLEKRVASFSREYHYNHPKFQSYDHKGFKENKVRRDNVQFKVISSRDSIWHSSKPNFPTTRSRNTKSQASQGAPPEVVRARDKASDVSASQNLKDQKKSGAKLSPTKLRASSSREYLVRQDPVNISSKDSTQFSSDYQVSKDSTESPSNHQVSKDSTQFPSNHQVSKDSTQFPSDYQVSKDSTQFATNHQVSKDAPEILSDHQVSKDSSEILSDQQASRDYTVFLSDGPSLSSYPKSSTPITSGQKTSLSFDIGRSALFKLDDSASFFSDIPGKDIKSKQSHSDSVTNHSNVTLSSNEISPSCASIGCSPFSPSKGKDSSRPRQGYSNSFSGSGTEGSRLHTNKQRVSHDTCTSQSEDVGSLSDHQKWGAKISLEGSFDELNMIPAGHQTCNMGKKKALRITKQIQREGVSGDTQVKTSYSPNRVPSNGMLEEDLGSIPMHRSLDRSKTKLLTGPESSFCIGDPCDVGTSLNSVHSKSVLSQLNLPQCQPVTVPLSGTEDEEAEAMVEDSFIDEILKLEEVQKIIRQAKMEKPSGGVKNKLLSSKIKFVNNL